MRNIDDIIGNPVTSDGSSGEHRVMVARLGRETGEVRGLKNDKGMNALK